MFTFSVNTQILLCDWETWETQVHVYAIYYVVVLKLSHNTVPVTAMWENIKLARQASFEMVNFNVSYDLFLLLASGNI